MNNKKRITLLIILGTLIVFGVVIGISYGYFSAKITGEGKVDIINTAKLELEFIDGPMIELPNAVPGDSVTKTFTVKNKSTVDVSYQIIFSGLFNTFINDELVYSLNEDAKGAIVSLEPISSNLIVGNVDISIGEEHSYTLIIKFLNKDEPQNYNMGAEFGATVNIVDTGYIEDSNSVFTTIARSWTNILSTYHDAYGSALVFFGESDSDGSLGDDSTRPTYGASLIDEAGVHAFYYYDADSKTCVINGRGGNGIEVFNSATLSTCKDLLDLPELLSTKAIGTYVNYDAGNWSSSSTLDTPFGGYSVGGSRNSTVSCNGDYLETPSGWRIFDVDSVTGEVYIIHAGTPECYTYTETLADDTVNDILTHDYSMYVNNSYATSAKVLTLNDLQLWYNKHVDGTTFSYGSTYTNYMIMNGTNYYVATKYNDWNIFYFSKYGYLGANSGTKGLRIIVKLKPGVLVYSGVGSEANSFDISNNNYVVPPKDPAVINVSKGYITGYWQNWNTVIDAKEYNIKLRHVPTYYNQVNISFVTPTATKGEVSFGLDQYLSEHLDYYDGEFREDIKFVQARGQKVVLAIGGSSAELIINDEASKKAFINSIKPIITSYGFDGIDVNIENTIYPTYLYQALLELKQTYGSKFIISAAPQTVDFKVNKTGVPSGTYYELMVLGKDIITTYNMQYYNSGDMYGMNGTAYYPVTIDFLTALTVNMIEAGFSPKQFGLGIIANPSNSQYTSSVLAVKAYNSLKSGIKDPAATYTPPRAYGAIGGYMVWSINYDASQDYMFAKDFYNSLK